jgi:uncharacterized protein
MKLIFVLLVLVTAINSELKAQQQDDGKLKNKAVLVFTKNGKGYVHDNIASSITAIQNLRKKLNFKVDTTTDAGIFTDDNLKKYDAIIFSNTNNDVFDTDQQKNSFHALYRSRRWFYGNTFCCWNGEKLEIV